MERIKEELNRYKWIFLAGMIVAILIGLIMANLHVLRFMGYKMQDNEMGIINILENTIKSNNGQSEWYFAQGVDYLLKKEELSKESLQFFEENFELFGMDIRLEIINRSNKKNMFMTNSLPLMETLITNIDNPYSQGYVKRMENIELEQGLLMYYGNNPEVDAAFINSMYKLLQVYPNKLPFDKFQFDLYGVLCLKEEQDEEKKTTIFSKLEPLKAKENLFNILKQKELDGEQLRIWVEFLNKTHILESEEYINFNTMYSEVYLIRSQYKELDSKEIELKNKKEAVEIQIEQSMKEVQTKQAATTALQNEVNTIEGKLNELTNYAYMALYIEKSAGTESSEYEASIPRKGLFRNYKASDQKYIVKLSETSFLSPGVYYIDIYLKGTKISSNGNEYPYYVEVSSSELANIDTLQQQRNEKMQVKTHLEQEIATLQAEIDKIKVEAGYKENQEELKNIVIQREELVKKLNERMVEIKTLFGLGHLTIPINLTTNEEELGQGSK